jgi:hypothetical protein
MSLTKPNSSSIIQAVDGATTRVRTRAVDVSFNEVFDMYNSHELIINPDFQRLFRWPESKRSQFIESLILELPVPPIYVIEVEDGVYELIDGLQRISSYFHFRGLDVSGQSSEPLRLSECDVLPELNGFTYEQLPQAIQIKLKRHFIRMEVLRRESDKRLRYYMFKRLNTGGELLSPQELRNCTIRLLDNTFNEFLKRMVKDPNYEKCMSQLTDEKKEQMYLEEYVLRFFAFKNYRDKYVKDIGDFLTAYMEAVSDIDRGAVTFNYASEEKVFRDTFRLLSEAHGEQVFSGINKQGNPQGYFSALVFEALTLGIQPHLEKLTKANGTRKTHFKNAISDLKANADFQRSTKGGGKNYAAALKNRIQFVEKAVSECLA